MLQRIQRAAVPGCAVFHLDALLVQAKHGSPHKGPGIFLFQKGQQCPGSDQSLRFNHNIVVHQQGMGKPQLILSAAHLDQVTGKAPCTAQIPVRVNMDMLCLQPFPLQAFPVVRDKDLQTLPHGTGGIFQNTLSQDAQILLDKRFPAKGADTDPYPDFIPSVLRHIRGIVSPVHPASVRQSFQLKAVHSSAVSLRKCKCKRFPSLRFRRILRQNRPDDIPEYFFLRDQCHFDMPGQFKLQRKV